MADLAVVVRGRLLEEARVPVCGIAVLLAGSRGQTPVGVTFATGRVLITAIFRSTPRSVFRLIRVE